MRGEENAGGTDLLSAELHLHAQVRWRAAVRPAPRRQWAGILSISQAIVVVIRVAGVPLPIEVIVGLVRVDLRGAVVFFIGDLIRVSIDDRTPVRI